jgi:hypothetical protein
MGHIFMTDGEPTSGILLPEKLSSYINESFSNIFIGFGKEHNSKLLRMFSEKKKSEYYFVDNLENTGLIYGECIHQFLYPAIKQMKIYIEYGSIYNWKTNKWEQIIEEDVVIGESEKIYHLRIENSNELSVTIYGNTDFCNDPTANNDNQKLIDIVYVLPNLVDFSGNKTELSDLTKYMFRQKVQELLYESCHNNDEYENQFFRKKSIFDFREGKKVFKHKIKELFRKMKEYMITENMTNDSFMTLLCDDLYILYNTYGTKYGAMYSNTRQISQGKQKIYNTGSQIEEESSDLDENYNCPDLENDIEQYTSPQHTTTCYSNPGILHTMHSISQSNDDDFEMI